VLIEEKDVIANELANMVKVCNDYMSQIADLRKELESLMAQIKAKDEGKVSRST